MFRQWMILMAEVDAGGGGGGGTPPAGAGGDAGAAGGGGTPPAPGGAGGSAGGEGEKPPRDDGRNDKGQFAKKEGGDGEAGKEKPEPPRKVKVPWKFKDKEGRETSGEDEIEEKDLVRSHQIVRGLRLKHEEGVREREALQQQIAELQGKLQSAAQGDLSAILPEDANQIEWTAQQLEQRLQEQALDPKDRQIAQLTKQLQQHAEREAERQRQAEAQEHDRQARLRVQWIGQTVIPLVEKHGLPRNDLVLERAVKYLYSAERQGITDPDPELIAEEVINEFTGTLETVTEKMDGAKVLKLFPRLAAKIAEALREQYKVKKAAAAPPAPKKDDAQRQQERGKEPAVAPQRKLMSDKEMDAHLGIPR